MLDDWTSRWNDPRRGYEARDQHILDHGYVRTTPEIAQFLAPHGPWLEIGAGTGAMAKAIEDAGGTIIATDAYASHGAEGWHGRHFRVYCMDAQRAVMKTRRVNLSVLVSWPSYDEDWAYKAVRHLRVGDKLAYIGEGEGGCTADDQFHELLARDFEEIGEVPVEQFWGIRDYCTLHVRKRLT